MSLLSISNLVAGYGDFQALFGVSLSVEEGQVAQLSSAPMARARPRCSRQSPVFSIHSRRRTSSSMAIP